MLKIGYALATLLSTHIFEYFHESINLGSSHFLLHWHWKTNVGTRIHIFNYKRYFYFKNSSKPIINKRLLKRQVLVLKILIRTRFGSKLFIHDDHRNVKRITKVQNLIKLWGLTFPQTQALYSSVASRSWIELGS